MKINAKIQVPPNWLYGVVVRYSAIYRAMVYLLVLINWNNIKNTSNFIFHVFLEHKKRTQTRKK